MARVKNFRILVASDGSLAATAATVTAVHFPWPAGTLAYGVVSREPGTNKDWYSLEGALEQAAVKSTAAFRHPKDRSIRSGQHQPKTDGRGP